MTGREAVNSPASTAEANVRPVTVLSYIIKHRNNFRTLVYRRGTNNEMKMTWKKALESYVEPLSRHLFGRTEETHEKLS